MSLLKLIGFDPIEEAEAFADIKDRIGLQTSPKLLIVFLARGVNDIVGSLQEIKDHTETAKVVFVVPNLDVKTMSACFAGGADGYVLESISRDALAESLKLVRAGEKVLPSELASLFPMLAANIAAPENSAIPTGWSDLSRREIEILQCLSNGQSNKVIAKTLDIAEATVKVHVKRILRKARVNNRTQAALWGVAAGFASTPNLEFQMKRSS